MSTTPHDGARPIVKITIQPGTDSRRQRVSGWFDAFYGALQLSASDRPLRDAALRLIELGAPPHTKITATHVLQQVMTTTLDVAAEGWDVGFDVDNNVVPFRRPAQRSTTTGSGGDAA
jgi:hypothetical protein